MPSLLRAIPCAWLALICHAQDPTFEAASVKPFPEGTPVQMSGCLGGPGTDDPGQTHCIDVTLRTLLMRAYQVRNQEIFGPGWLDTAHYNILAKLPTGAVKGQVPAMFRALLAERFQVVLHHETRDLSAYSLTVAKGGLKLTESSPNPPDDAGQADGPPPVGKDGFPILRPSIIRNGPIILYRHGQARLQGSNMKVARLAESLTSQLDRIVTDNTGLDKSYDITLTWTPDRFEPGAGSTSDEAPLSLFQAIEQQLGLRLVQTKIQRDVLVIDRAEKVPIQ